MAPPERDLMFVLGSPIGLAPGEREHGERTKRSFAPSGRGG
jgi:hypothetical protein